MKYKTALVSSVREMVKFINEEENKDGEMIERELVSFSINPRDSVWFVYKEQRVGLMPA